MEQLEKWKAWLGQYPGWQDLPAVDHTAGALGSMGLFPMGTQVLQRQEDVVGNRYVRCRSVCQLRLVTAAAAGAAVFMDFAGWVQTQSASGNPVGLGDIPATETVSAEKGRLQRQDMGGTATYVIDLVCEYTRVYPAQESR